MELNWEKTALLFRKWNWDYLKKSKKELCTSSLSRKGWGPKNQKVGQPSFHWEATRLVLPHHCPLLSLPLILPVCKQSLDWEFSTDNVCVCVCVCMHTQALIVLYSKPGSSSPTNEVLKTEKGTEDEPQRHCMLGSTASPWILPDERFNHQGRRGPPEAWQDPVGLLDTKVFLCPRF